MPSRQDSGANSQFNMTMGNRNDNFKVVIRVRPPLQREQIESCQFRSIVNINNDSKSISIMEYLGAEVSEAEK